MYKNQISKCFLRKKGFHGLYYHITSAETLTGENCCIVRTSPHTPHPRPLPSQRRDVRLFQNWWKIENKEGVWTFLLEKGWGKEKWEGVIVYWGFSGDSSWCSIGKSSRCVFLFFVNKDVLRNNCLNKIWDNWLCNIFVSVDSYNICIVLTVKVLIVIIFIITNVLLDIFFLLF